MQNVGTRTKILTAALKEFAHFGFEGATTKNIAREAGVNEVTLFRLFGSKEHLFESAITGIKERVLQILKGNLEMSGDLNKDLLQTALNMMSFMEVRKEMVAMLLFESRRSEVVSQAVSAIPKALIGQAEEILHRRTVRLGVAHSDIHAAAFILASYVFMRVIIRETLLGEPSSQEDRKKDMESMVGILTRGLFSQGNSTVSTGELHE